MLIFILHWSFIWIIMSHYSCVNTNPWITALTLMFILQTKHHTHQGKRIKPDEPWTLSFIPDASSACFSIIGSLIYLYLSNVWEMTRECADWGHICSSICQNKLRNNRNKAVLLHTDKHWAIFKTIDSELVAGLVGCSPVCNGYLPKLVTRSRLIGGTRGTYTIWSRWF